MCETVPVEDLFAQKPALLAQIYRQLIAQIKKEGAIRVSTSSKAITLSGKTGFMIVYPKKDNLDVGIFLRRRAEGFPVYKIQQQGKSRFVHWVRLYEMDDLDTTVITLAAEARLLTI